MQGRHSATWRPQMWNPFGSGDGGPKDVIARTRSQFLRGMLRSVPFNGTSTSEMALITKHPRWYSLFSTPVCVLDPRDMTNNPMYYGESRGCKTIVVPCHLTEPVNAKVIAKLMQINPSMDNLWLGASVEKEAQELARAIEHGRLGAQIVRLTLCHWTNAQAISAVSLALRNVEIIDLFGISDIEVPEWSMVAEDVQAVCYLAEMHPKLRAVEGHQAVLTAMHHALRDSRCQHNIALVPVGDVWTSVWYVAWHLLVITLALPFYYGGRRWVNMYGPEERKKTLQGFMSMVWTLSVLGYFTAEQFFFRYRYGPGWTRLMSFLLRVVAKRL